MHIGLVLNIIVVNRIIVAQVIQHVQGQILPGHPVLLQLPIHEVGVVGLPVHGDLIVVIVHGGGHALNREILIQIISPGLGVADQLVQRQLLAEPGAVADPHNGPLHIQLSICLKHIPVAHIAEYLLNVLLQTGRKLGGVLIHLIVNPADPLAVVRVEVHGADSGRGDDQKQHMHHG